TLGVVGRKGWFRLSVPGPGGGRYTSWCRLVDLAPDLSRVVLYVGAFYDLPAYPEDFRARLEASLGGWPGPPDYAFMRAGRKDEDAHEEQATRLAEYLTKVLVFTIRTERWDLLLGYQPIVDEIEHAFEPGPGGGSPERVERAFQTVDRSVAEILGALRPGDSMVVLSDHGIVPLTKAVNIERFFKDKGWTIAKEKEGLPAEARRVQISSSSGIAHLYVDPALPAAARDEAAAALLHDARGLPEEVIDEVLLRKDLARVELDNPRSGDVVVLLKPGIEFSRSLPEVLGPAHQKGGHGYRNATAVLDASVMALGPGIKPARPATVSILDVAPLAARALGIEPPRRRPSSPE
ncbi:MAG: alkaline phosphatase family protein, partial [Thermoanaerobaculia bacterium]|nr:alkaline phosphatase family protein [Thermoanaerobaculia bacterium]